MPELGETVIFELIDGGCPPGAYYGSGTAQTRVVLARGDVDIRTRGAVAEWYELLLSDPTSNPDLRAVQRRRVNFEYRATAGAFKMIEQDTMAVAVPWASDDPRSPKVESILSFLGGKVESGFVLLGPKQVRALQDVTVQLRRRVLDAAIASGLASRVNDRLYRWEGDYDAVTGLVFSPAAREELIW
jgi:hypothetical protein